MDALVKATIDFEVALDEFNAAVYRDPRPHAGYFALANDAVQAAVEVALAMSDADVNGRPNCIDDEHELWGAMVDAEVMEFRRARTARVRAAGGFLSAREYAEARLA